VENIVLLERVSRLRRSQARSSHPCRRLPDRNSPRSRYTRSTQWVHGAKPRSTCHQSSEQFRIRMRLAGLHDPKSGFPTARRGKIP